MKESSEEPGSIDLTEGCVYVFGRFRADPAERRLYRDAEPVALTAKGFDLLLALIEDPGRLKTREALIERLWPRTIVEENNLSWNIRAVRKALDDGEDPAWIETVRGHGYRFVGEVRRQPRTPPAALAPVAPPENESETEARIDRAVLRRRRWWLPVGSLMLALAVAWIALGSWFPDPEAEPVDPNSLAVLPFANLDGTADDGWFAAGIQSTILAKLAAIADLKVLSRSATQDLTDLQREAAELARELGVAFVLEGTVQRHEQRINVNVVLVDGANGQHAWGQTYTREVGDVFEVQNDIAEQVARALRVAMTRSERSQMQFVPTRNLAAYDNFLRAEYLAEQIAAQRAQDPAATAAEARRLYRLAIADDPTFALAWARLSYVESLSGWYYLDTDPATQRSADQAARTAVALAPDLPQGHLALGYVHYYRDRDYERALSEFELARVGQPGDGEISVAIASVLRRQGRVEGAIAAYEQAISLDPRNPRWHLERGHALMMQRRYADAVASYDRSLAANPDQDSARLHRVIGRLMAGKVSEAAADFQALPPSAGENRYRYGVGFAIAWLQRDSATALTALDSAPDWVITPFQPTTRTPKALLRGMALQLGNNEDAATEAFALAGKQVSERLAEGDQDRNIHIMQALVLAYSGESETALRIARGITDSLPLSRDAVTAPPFHLALAEIEALSGEPAQSAQHLRELLDRPAGHVLSTALIEADARFDRVRGEVRLSDYPSD